MNDDDALNILKAVHLYAITCDPDARLPGGVRAQDLADLCVRAALSFTRLAKVRNLSSRLRQCSDKSPQAFADELDELLKP